MRVMALDHVNINTTRLEETIRFYVEGLGLALGAMPASLKTGKPADVRGARVCDVFGNAIFHFIHSDKAQTATPFAPIDHVALACEDREGFIARLTAGGYPFESVDLSEYGRYQLVVRDPNGITIHLSFLIGKDGART
jgi:catechol 2,3-dioxygenase-like lactoylglutathione lyase family enzyme